jgi:hypothetical protein
MAEDDIVQRIVLTGNAEVIAAFAAIEEAGKRAFESISEAAKTLAGTDEATAKIQEAAAAIKEAQQGVAESQAALAAAQSAANAATAEGMEKIVDATKKVTEAQAGLVAAQTAAGEAVGNKFGAGLRTAGLLLVGLAAGVGIAVTGLFEFAKSAAASADAAGGLAEKFGDTVEKTDAFISGMASMGVSTGELGNAFRHMSFVIDNVWTEVKKQSRESADQLKSDALSIAQAQSGLADAIQKAATAERDASLTRQGNALSVADAQAKLADLDAKRLKGAGVDTSQLERQNALLKDQAEYEHAVLAVKQAKAQAADAEEAAERKIQDAANAAEKAQLDLSAARRKAEEDSRNNIDNVAAAVKKLGEGAPDALKGIENSAENIVRGIVKNVGASTSALEGFKGSLTDVNQASPTVKAALLAMADAFSHTEDNGLKTAVAMRFFGRSVGQDMIEGLSEGSAALLKAAARIEGLGLAITKTDVASGRAFRSAFTELSDTISHIADKVATQLQPPFTLAFSAINKYFEENNTAIRKWANDLGASAIPVVESFARVLLGVPDAAKDQWLLDYVQKVKDFGAAIKTVAGIVSDAAQKLKSFADDVANALNNAFGTNLNSVDILFGAFILRAVGGFGLLEKAGEKLATALGISFLRLAGTLGAVLAALALGYEIYQKVKEAVNQTPEQQKQIQEAHQKEKDKIQDAAQDFEDKDITEKERDDRIEKAKEEYVRRKDEINKQSAASDKQAAHEAVTAKEEETKKWIEEESAKSRATQEALLRDQQAYKEHQVDQERSHTQEAATSPQAQEEQAKRRAEVAASGAGVAGEASRIGFGHGAEVKSVLESPAKNLDNASGKLAAAADILSKGGLGGGGGVGGGASSPVSSSNNTWGLSPEDAKLARQGVHTVKADTEGLQKLQRDYDAKFPLSAETQEVQDRVANREELNRRDSFIGPPDSEFPITRNKAGQALNPTSQRASRGAPRDQYDLNRGAQEQRDIAAQEAENQRKFSESIAKQGGVRSPDQSASAGQPPLSFPHYNDKLKNDVFPPGGVPIPRDRPAEANQTDQGVVQAVQQSGDKITQAVESTSKGGGNTEGVQQQTAVQQQTGILQQILSALSTFNTSRGGGGEGGADAAQSEQALKSATDELGQGMGGLNGAVQSLAEAFQSAISAINSAAAEAGAGTIGFASGGHVQGAGTGTSDSIPAMVSHGEYIHTAKATEHYGVGFMNAINNLKLPKFSVGGLVSGLTSFAFAPVVPHFASGGHVSVPAQASGSAGHMTVDFRTDHGDFSGLLAPDRVAKQLSRAAVNRQNVQTGTKPGWYKGKS